MWQACATQEEIAEAVGVDQKTIGNWEEEFVKSPEDGLLTNPPPCYPPNPSKPTNSEFAGLEGLSEKAAHESVTSGDLPPTPKSPKDHPWGTLAVLARPAKDGAMPLILFCPVILGLGLGCHPGRRQLIPCLLYGCHRSDLSPGRQPLGRSLWRVMVNRLPDMGHPSIPLHHGHGRATGRDRNALVIVYRISHRQQPALISVQNFRHTWIQFYYSPSIPYPPQLAQPRGDHLD